MEPDQKKKNDSSQGNILRRERLRNINLDLDSGLIERADVLYQYQEKMKSDLYTIFLKYIDKVQNTKQLDEILKVLTSIKDFNSIDEINDPFLKEFLVKGKEFTEAINNREELRLSIIQDKKESIPEHVISIIKNILLHYLEKELRPKLLEKERQNSFSLNEQIEKQPKKEISEDTQEQKKEISENTSANKDEKSKNKKPKTDQTSKVNSPEAQDTTEVSRSHSPSPIVYRGDSPMREQEQLRQFFKIPKREFESLSSTDLVKFIDKARDFKQLLGSLNLSPYEQELGHKMSVESPTDKAAQPLSKNFSTKENSRT